ncbi:hypothetical protein [Chitinophaga sp. LS1]|uniref:hypothetical protein n=1 Tax=Chitinophaga sp. LS1 TaxID=3051176 RepID=UPI002AAAF340|nr:hypothetical protein [Chitinophaga sp. LS1]WPV67836.1 hypothetical protein QQL36_03750 [Chitinophaga sp. LS1]
MTFPFLPLHDLRNCLEEYLFTPDDGTGFLYEKAQACIEHMHHTIADFMLSPKEDAVLKRYMRTWQEQIRQLFDLVPLSWVEDLDPDDPPAFDDPASWHKNICYECFRLLKEMQTQYPIYFEKSGAPPLIYIEVEKSMFHHKVLIIAQWMEKKGPQLQKLWQILHLSIQRIWNQEYIRFSYGEHDYTWNLITHLMTQIDTHGDNMGQRHMYSLLFYLNFNDTSFLQYLISGIKEEISRTIIPDKKIKILKKMDSTMGKLLVRNDVVLDPGNPPINIMLQRWLKGQLEELQS